MDDSGADGLDLDRGFHWICVERFGERAAGQRVRLVEGTGTTVSTPTVPDEPAPERKRDEVPVPWAVLGSGVFALVALKVVLKRRKSR